MSSTSYWRLLAPGGIGGETGLEPWHPLQPPVASPRRIWTLPDPRYQAAEGAAAPPENTLLLLLMHDASLAILRLPDGCLVPLTCVDKARDACLLPRSEDGHILAISDPDGAALIVDPVRDVVLCQIDDLRVSEAHPFSHSTAFRTCCSGNEHVLLADVHGQERKDHVWSWGKGPQVGQVGLHSQNFDSFTFTRIDFFQGMDVTQICAGRDFSLALAETGGGSDGLSSQDQDHHLHAEKDRKSCPLGLRLQSHAAGSKETLSNKSSLKSREELLESMEEDEHVELRKKKKNSSRSRVGAHNNAQPDDEYKAQESEEPKVERLAQSGLYINPSDALKFLTNQLSWVSIDSAKTQVTASISSNSTSSIETAEESKANEVGVNVPGGGSHLLSRATSAVTGIVGSTVSKLSYSFSLDGDSSQKLPRESDEYEETTSLVSAKADSEASTSMGIPLTSPLKSDNTNDSLSESIDPSSTDQSHKSPATNSSSSEHRHFLSMSTLDYFGTSKANNLPSSMFTSLHRAPSSVSSHSGNSNQTDGGKEQRKTSLKRTVWFWGRGNRGQSGEADKLDRLQPNLVSALQDYAIRKIACGRSHCLALTQGGSVFGWGDNVVGQSSCVSESDSKICHTPTVVELPVGETACDIAAYNTTSYILTDSGKLFRLGSDSGEKSGMIQVTVDKLSGVDSCISRRIIDCCYVMGNVTVVVPEIGPADPHVLNLKTLEKRFLHKITSIMYRVVEPAFRKSRDHKEERSSLRKALRNLITVIDENVSLLWDAYFYNDCESLPLLKQTSSLESAFLAYSGSVCDAYVADALDLDSREFFKLSPVICELLSSVCHVDSGSTGKDAFLNLLTHVLLQPVHLRDCMKSIVQAGRREGGKVPGVLRMCDNMEKVCITLQQLQKALEREEKLTLATKSFWQDPMAGKLESLQKSQRRMLLDSRSTPIAVSNAGSFSKNWLVLMNDMLIHTGYSSFLTHPLQTIWVTSRSGVSQGRHQSAAGNSSDAKHNRYEICLTMPEDMLLLSTTSAESKSKWLQTLQTAISATLKMEREKNAEKPPGLNQALGHHMTPPDKRHTNHTFSRISTLKGASYLGTWEDGKMNGYGTLTWPDARTYVGQFAQNQKHGIGRLKEKNGAVYEGQWKNDKFEGKGKVMYPNGDLYEGFLRDGKPHGHGTLKTGKFALGNAKVYTGEWVDGYKHGYGVLDDINNGEKHMGMWSSDSKHGPGCCVTHDGVYYEGQFSHNKMSGKGLMLFENDTSFEGSFADAWIFNGPGTLTYENGDCLEGTFHGNYNSPSGMKFNGMVRRGSNGQSHGRASSSLATQETTLYKEKLGSFSVSAQRKWTCIFAHFQDILDIPVEESDEQNSKVWDRIPHYISQGKNTLTIYAQINAQGKHKTRSGRQVTPPTEVIDGMEIIPEQRLALGKDLNHACYEEIISYLSKAFRSSLHPLHALMSVVIQSFNATYGGVRAHPRLLKHALEELRSVVVRVYRVVRTLFPALPLSGDMIWIDTDDQEGFIVTQGTIIYPYILPRINSSLFMLYALFYQKNDEEYWARIDKWNKHPDIAVLSFLGVDEKFWQISSSKEDVTLNVSDIKDRHFLEPIEQLQRLKAMMTPYDKMTVLVQTFREVNKLDPDNPWSMDELFPVFLYIVVRARIPQMGAEIHLFDDLMEPHFFSGGGQREGEFRFMYITLQAAYYQILRESQSM